MTQNKSITRFSFHLPKGRDVQPNLDTYCVIMNKPKDSKIDAIAIKKILFYYSSYFKNFVEDEDNSFSGHGDPFCSLAAVFGFDEKTKISVFLINPFYAEDCNPNPSPNIRRADALSCAPKKLLIKIKMWPTKKNPQEEL